MDAALRLLDVLWERYCDEVPYARTWLELAGGTLSTDHVAFRTLRRAGSGIATWAPVFERLGWKRAGTYAFPGDHLTAIHLSHPSGLPRIFLSELQVGALSPTAQRILDGLEPDPPPPWEPTLLERWLVAPAVPPSPTDLESLEGESQYGAWLLAFGRKVNHFAVAVDDVAAWHARLVAAGVPMRRAVEGAADAPLRQTATEAVRAPVPLRDGSTVEWPYAYLELAERKRGFDGFVVAQAGKLFEVTRRG